MADDRLAPPIRILAVDDSAVTREVLARLIQAQPDMQLVGAAASGHEAVRRAAELQPDIVLMDIHMPDLDGIQAAWLVSSGAPYGAVIMVTSEERIDFLQKAMSAGAQGYVLKPFGQGEQLFQTVREVHSRSAARRILSQSIDGTRPINGFGPHIGKRIVVLGAKGGVGSTTVAVNLSLLLHQDTNAAVALMDADFLAGDAALHFNVSPEHTILNLVPHIESLDSRLIEQVLVKPDQRVHVLARPTNPEQAEAVTAERVRTVLGSLAQMYEHVVIDVAPTYDDRMLSVLDLADVYIVVLTPHLGTLRSARHFLHIARTLGYASDRICFVLNRATHLAGLSLGDITRLLGTREVIQIPSGGAAVSQALNAGRPLVAFQPRSAVSRALQLVSHEVGRRIAGAGS